MPQTKEERNAYMREWRKQNKDKISEQNKKYRDAHKAEAKEYHKAWRDKNRDHLNELQREKYKENPQAFKDRKERYIASHIEKVKDSRHRYKVENRQKCTDYQRNKRHSDPVYKFRSSFTHLMSLYRRKSGYTGSKGTWEMVGCDFDTFLKHIQSQFEDGMTMEKYGHREGCWNIDHIVPISTAKTDEDIERLNHYSNLRPMWAIDNYRKSKKTP
jgi:hypothetical protein